RVVETQATPFGRDRGTEQPELLQALDQGSGVLVGVLQVARDRHHLAIDEATHGVDELGGQLGLLGGHRVRGHPGKSTTFVPAVQQFGRDGRQRTRASSVGPVAHRTDAAARLLTATTSQTATRRPRLRVGAAPGRGGSSSGGAPTASSAACTTVGSSSAGGSSTGTGC